MFGKLFIAASAAALAAATSTSKCNTGPVQCCNSVQSANGEAAAKQLALVGAVVQDVTIPVGLDCTPITVIGVSGNSCSSQPVCCENNNFNGVVAIGCKPTDVNL